MERKGKYETENTKKSKSMELEELKSIKRRNESKRA